MGSIPLEAAASRDAGGCFEELVRGRSAQPVQAGPAADRAEPGRGRRPRDGLPCGIAGRARRGRSAAWPGGRELACRWKRGPCAGGMVGAAMSRRAGLGSAATALVLVLTAGVGCGSPVRRTPGHGHPGAQAAAAKPQPAVVSLPRVRGGVPWPVRLRTAGGMFVVARDGAVRWLGPPWPARAPAGPPAGFLLVRPVPGP